MTSLSTPLTTSASYSPVAVANGLAFVAGQAAIGPDGTVVAPNDAYEQSIYTFGLISDILGQIGSDLTRVASATVFITHVSHLVNFNRAWLLAFPEHKPARATVVCGLLVEGLVVEIQVVAVAPEEVTA